MEDTLIMPATQQETERVCGQVERYVMLRGDCVEILKTIPDNSVELIVTDPPYNEVNRVTNGLREIDKGVADSEKIDIDYLVSEFSRICIGSIYVWCGIEQVSQWRKAFVDNKWSTRQCAWQKTNPSPMNAQHLWLSGMELCVYAKKPKATFNRFYEVPLWKGASKPKESKHPTNKPVWLMEEIIDASSQIGDTVLDPFMGGGSTGVACKKLGRNFIGVEKEPKWFDMAKQRIEAT